MKKLYILLFSILISGLSFGQASITALNNAYSENFDGMTSLGTTFPTNWTAIRAAGSGTLNQVLTMAVTDGATTSGNIYNVGTASAPDRAFGSLASGTTVPAFGMSFINNTGDQITQFNIALLVEQWRSGSSNSVNEVLAFSYSIDATGLDNGTWVTASTLDINEILTTTTAAAAVDGNLPANQAAMNVTVTMSSPLVNGGTLWIKWVDTNDSGSDGILAIDDFSFTATSSALISTLTINNGPADGSNTIGSPEDVNATIDFITTNFTMSNDAGGGVSDNSGDGYIAWYVEDTSDNSMVDSGNIFTSNDGFEYPISGLTVTKTYFFFSELVDNSGNSLVPAVTYSFTITIPAYNDVPDLATLRAGTVDPDTYYRVTGEVINTYSRSLNNQKYFQDATGGILVHDPFFDISTVYSEGDGVTNIRGHLELFNGLLELIPTFADWGAPSSTGNIITPEVVTIADVQASLGTYESKLVRLNGVTFADGNGINNFTAPLNYVINDGTASTFRTNFSEADYIGQTIPTGATNMLVIVGNFNGAEQFTARSLSELTLSTKFNQIKGFAMYPNPTSLGYVNITSKSNAKMSVAVFDMLGKQVINETVSNNTLNVSNLTSGLYLMKVSQDNAISTTKLVIE
ncbi:T9SS type A sorting domain-containing protein [Gaetbulibacter sp. M235]|uniref:T9SS type A sorting domain-containing protein n=1 Tax=Gaetbulibacter sp. M235 TaxID=3126510 RepID=UPI00374E402B